MRMNPTGSVPMLRVGNSNVISQGQVLFDWIIQTSPKAKEMFFHEDQKNTINAIQRFFFREMRGNTSQLIRRLALKVLDPENAPDTSNADVKRKVEVRMAEFEKKRLSKLGELLKDDQKYLTGSQMSFVDIVIYCEVNQVLAMYDRTIPQHETKLVEWYEMMGEDEIIKDVSKKLNQVLENHPKLKETVTLSV